MYGRIIFPSLARYFLTKFLFKIPKSAFAGKTRSLKQLPIGKGQWNSWVGYELSLMAAPLEKGVSKATVVLVPSTPSVVWIFS